MGSKEYKITICLFAIVIFSLVSFDSCLLKKSISISDCYAEKNFIRIVLNCNNWTQNINGFELENESDYYSVMKDKIITKITTKDRLDVSVECTGQNIKTNKEYKMILTFPGGRVTANIFFGNPIEKVENVFPSDDSEHVRIIIFDKTSTVGI